MKAAALNFATKGLLENYLGGWFDADMFYRKFTRKELRDMLRLLYSFQVERNPRAFCSMCKRRMISHIEFYVKAHRLDRNPEAFRERYFRLLGSLSGVKEEHAKLIDKP